MLCCHLGQNLHVLLAQQLLVELLRPFGLPLATVCVLLRL
jgi:hypothetical protein